MFGPALRYIHENFKECELSQHFYIASDGVSGVASQDYAEQNASGIFYQFLYVTLLPPNTFFTIENNIALLNPVQINTTTYFPIPSVRKNTIMKVICSDLTAKFTVCFQFIFKKEKHGR
jgi:hypothetical protein